MKSLKNHKQQGSTWNEADVLKVLLEFNIHLEILLFPNYLGKEKKNL